MEYKNNSMNNSFLFYVFFIFCILFSESVSSVGNNSQLNMSFLNNNSNINLATNSNIKDPKNNQPADSSVNINLWQTNTVDDSHDFSTNQFNWQQRKILKQKAYKIYTDLNFVIEDINDIINIFNNKINDIQNLVINFNSLIESRCKNLNHEYKIVSDFMNYIEEWNQKINLFKKTVYYNLHKDFRGKIDLEKQNFENIVNMIRHYQKSILQMYDLEEILTKSVRNLFDLQTKAVDYENFAWSKYQQLDELINDKSAETNFLEINNASDNIIAINNYLRSDYLDFFNQGMINLNNANSSILLAVDNLITYIDQRNLFINSLEKEIAVYDEMKEKEKLALEEEKMRVENDLKLKEEKKKLALAEAANQAPWYNKIISTAISYIIFFKEQIIKVYDWFIAKGISYYNLVFNYSSNVFNGKFNKTKIKNETLALEVSPEVSLFPAASDKQEVVLFTSPESNQVNQDALPSITQEQLVDNNKKIIEEVVSDEIPMQDVFGVIPQNYVNQEKEKIGASSYPKKINVIDGVAPQSSNKGNEIESPLLLVSEEIITPDANQSTVQELKSEKNTFQYKPLEVSDLSNQQRDSLLPDLSDLEKQNKSNVSHFIDPNPPVNQIFNATSSSSQSKARKGNVANNLKENDLNKDGSSEENHNSNISLKHKSNHKKKKKVNKNNKRRNVGNHKKNSN